MVRESSSGYSGSSGSKITEVDATTMQNMNMNMSVSVKLNLIIIVEEAEKRREEVTVDTIEFLSKNPRNLEVLLRDQKSPIVAGRILLSYSQR